MADIIRGDLAIDAKLIKGARGAYEIFANKELIFSKHAEGRFPEDDEVLEALRLRKEHVSA